MTGHELGWLIAGALLAAAAAGWVLHWLWCLLARATSSERARIEALVAELAAAEDAREAAEARAAGAEAALAETLAQAERQIAAAEADRDARIAGAEAAAATAVREARAEAQTAWDGLALARRRIAELEQDAG